MSKTYTTVSGDMWDTIAYKTLGDEAYTDKFIKNNIQYRDIVIFPAGIVLDIPDVETEFSAKLPPWKRGLAYE
ncbi:tail protein X [Tissierella sp. MSJ-40]|uniref:Tail protein X n=1 Tax=Tissierella simiarum TaxID=2841534 RepID=A0ABS6E5U8_9FIRM|nr:tail protein X [Tissierella simiarum]MBU5438287.1 tail protein X [Tissierella simiarum]